MKSNICYKERVKFERNKGGVTKKRDNKEQSTSMWKELPMHKSLSNF